MLERLATGGEFRWYGPYFPYGRGPWGPADHSPLRGQSGQSVGRRQARGSVRGSVAPFRWVPKRCDRTWKRECGCRRRTCGCVGKGRGNECSCEMREHGSGGSTGWLNAQPASHLLACLNLIRCPLPADLRLLSLGTGRWLLPALGLELLLRLPEK